MKRYLLLLLIPISLKAQVKGRLIDQVTNKSVPYVNIWVENEPFGTTSDEKGFFKLDKDYQSKDVIFSAIGYETKKVSWGSISSIVKLQPQVIELNEFVFNSNKEPIEKITGEFKKSRINKFFGAGEKPNIWARFFPYQQTYLKTPYLKKVRVYSMSENANTKFNVRIYAIDSLGKPGKYLYDKNIIGIAEKGKKLTEIDLASFDIIMPEKGVFIAIEWFIIESNKYESYYKEKGSRKKIIETCYDPCFGTISVESNENSWLFKGGKWSRIVEDIFDDLKETVKKKYSLLAVELTLTN